MYRRDLFEDPRERADFKAKFGRDLAFPEMWDELDQVAGFFHRPDKGLQGWGYGFAMVMSFISGVAWDLAGSASAAFIPILLGCLPILFATPTFSQAKTVQAFR